MMVSFCAVLFPRDVLDEILDLIESVSGGGGMVPFALNDEIWIYFLDILRWKTHQSATF